ncbi:MAG: Calx-beta domain-containing protein [Verrucomicrobiales bacterium]
MVIKREGGDLSQPLTVALDLSGSATSAQDFEPVADQITIPAGATEATVAIKANADSEVEGEESVTVTALQGDGFTLASASASILIEDATAVTEPPVAGVSIDDWKWTHFGAYAAHPLYGADGGDPDHDGLSNLYEYAMGSDPMRKTGEAPLRGVRAEAGNLVAFYTRNPAAVDARIVIEASADLRAWQDAEGAAGQEVVGEEGGNELIKVSLPLDGAHRFLRLGVSRVAAATSTEA